MNGIVPWFPEEMRPLILVARKKPPVKSGMVDVAEVVLPVFTPRLRSLLWLANVPHCQWSPISLIEWRGRPLIFDGSHRLLLARLRGLTCLPFLEYAP